MPKGRTTGAVFRVVIQKDETVSRIAVWARAMFDLDPDNPMTAEELNVAVAQWCKQQLRIAVQGYDVDQAVSQARRDVPKLED